MAAAAVMKMTCARCSVAAGLPPGCGVAVLVT